MGKYSKHMSQELRIPNFSFGATAVIRPLPGGTRKVLPNDLLAKSLKDTWAVKSGEPGEKVKRPGGEGSDG